MKFPNLRKTALFSVLAAGTIASEAYAANPVSVNANAPKAAVNPGNVNPTIKKKVNNEGQSFQVVFDWLRIQTFSTFTGLLDSYKYFFDLLPGWVTEYVPSTPSKFFGGKVAGTLYAGPKNSFDYVAVTANNKGDVWEEGVLVNGNPKIPVPIDGGASLLLVAGAAYGLKRLRTKKGAAPETEK